MRLLRDTLARLTLCAVVCTPGVYADSDSEQTLARLLEQVRQLQRSDQRHNQEREQRFLQARDDQRRLLEEAEQEKLRLQAESERLEQTFNDNEVELQGLETIYRQRVGNLVELSGVMRQVSERLYSELDDTFLGIHVEGWREKLADLKNQDGLPTVDDIEVLWEFFLRYLLIQSQNLRFTTDVIYSDGGSRRHDVVHVGSFTSIADGRFLSYLPENRRFVMLDRQPPSRYLKAAQAYASADDDELATAPIDPSRGVLLSLLIRTPTIQERVDQGGLIAYIILVIGAIGLLLGIGRTLSLGWVARKVRKQAANPDTLGDNPLGRIFSAYRDNIKIGMEAMELKLDEMIVAELPRLERGLATLKVFAVIAPLLGLLGTVTGMIETFQSITLFGTGDPKLMSGGISQALITTALGLIVAIPIILLHTYVNGKSRMIREVLEEQSAGLMARHVSERNQ